MIFPEAVTELETYRQFAAAMKVPILANITEFGVTPLFTVEELARARCFPGALSAFRISRDECCRPERVSDNTHAKARRKM